MPRPRIPERRERLLDAAEALVLERGFDAVSVSAIAAAAGVGKGAVYLEFESKHAILDALLQRGAERIDERMRARLGEHPPLSEVYRAWAGALSADPLLVAAYLDDRGVLGAHVGDVADGRYRDRHLKVVDWLRASQERGAIMADVDVEALALALSSASIGLLSVARLLGPVDSGQLERAIDTIGRMVETFERT